MRRKDAVRKIAAAGLISITLGAWGRDAVAAEIVAPPQPKCIAILPIQNEGDPRYTLSEDQSDLLRLFDFIKERQGKTTPDRETGKAGRIQETLTFLLSKDLAGRGYSVFAGGDYGNFYHAVEARRQSMSYVDLQKFIPANIFLLVTFDTWDASDFDSEGKLKIGFKAYVIDPQQPANKGIVWSNGATRCIELEKSDFLFRKRQEEILREVARTVLKGFPKAAVAGLHK